MQSPAAIGIAVGVVSAYFLRNVWALLLAYLVEAFLGPYSPTFFSPSETPIQI